MGRAKLTMEYIKKEKPRNNAFQKRKNGLKKKIKELTTLCDVKAIMVIYGPKQTPVQDHPLQPDIWPEDRVDDVLELINKYQVQPTDERNKRTSFLSSFFEDRNKKAHVALTKLRKSNVEAKYPPWDQRFDNLSQDKLIKISRFLETKLGYAKKFKIMKENKSNYNAYHMQQQQQKMLPKKRSRDFEGSNQPDKFLITPALREPIYNSYNSHLPMPLQMHIPMPMPMPLQQYRPTLDQCMIQRTISLNNPYVGGTSNLNNPYVGGSSNIIYATPLVKAEPNMPFNDPMTGMAQSISSLNNLMTAPRMHYFGDSMQAMTHSYTDGAMQPIPQSYVEYPVRSTAASSQMLAVSPFQKTDNERYYKY